MGADIKRKEARKRKFRGQNNESLLEAGVKMNLEGTSADEPAKKKSKQAPPPSSRNVYTLEKNTIGKVAVADESTEQGIEEHLATQKAQRFIVFIGPSALFAFAGFSRLTAYISTRQSSLHCNG